MKLSINWKNDTQASAHLDSVNGKASSFTVSMTGLRAMAARAELELDRRGVLRKNRKGSRLLATPAGPSAASYKYSAISTDVVLMRGAKEWYLTEAKRTSVNPREAERFLLAVSAAAGDNIKAKAFENITIDKANEQDAL
tara:strand:+ start:213 stop:632 length:420 start_codon:yes stop_codon:yes gene_type:complete